MLEHGGQRAAGHLPDRQSPCRATAGQDREASVQRAIVDVLEIQRHGHAWPATSPSTRHDVLPREGVPAQCEVDLQTKTSTLNWPTAFELVDGEVHALAEEVEQGAIHSFVSDQSNEIR